MRILDHLEPASVFRFVEDLCSIPHGSGNPGAVCRYCEEFAAARGLAFHRDGADNVIIIKPAAPGYENAEPLILQGHLDMVCVKDPDCGIDFEKDGLDLAVDGDWVYARGTTLGGDDGVAVAMIMAVLDAKDLTHPRLEAVFTTDEEVGMLGASALDVSPLRGRRLLNLDSAEGLLTVGCAGGVLADCALPIRRTPAEGLSVSVAVDGLAGGHSGVEIHKGRGNSNRLMGRLLDELRRTLPLRLIDLHGGEKNNAIPLKTDAILVIDPKDADRAAAAAEAFGKLLKAEYAASDGNVRVTLHENGTYTGLALTPEDTERAIALLTVSPNGVQEMSREIPGLVQTSLNLGIVALEEAALRSTFCVRSNMRSQKEMLQRQLELLTGLLGGSIRFSADYPAWEYRSDSPLRELVTKFYRAQYGKEPRITAVHGGLECGILSAKLPGVDCVSLGPALQDVHTTGERMSVSSVQRLWKLLTAILEAAR
jgi:dipeptidase D